MRCKRLRIHSRYYDLSYDLPKMPILEELELSINDSEDVENLLYSFRVGSPLLGFLKLSTDVGKQLYSLPPFLKRIRHLALGQYLPSIYQQQLFSQLMQLESLT